MISSLCIINIDVLCRILSTEFQENYLKQKYSYNHSKSFHLNKEKRGENERAFQIRHFQVKALRPSY